MQKGDGSLNILMNGIKYLNKAFVYLSAALMATLSVIVFYEVLARYVFNSPTIWVNEISSYILQFIVFFTMGYLLIKDEHLKVTFILDRFHGKAKKALRIFNNLLVLPYAGALLVYGWVVTERAYAMESTSPTLLAVPLWIPSSFIFLGGGLLILGAICSILMIAFKMPDEDSADDKGGVTID